MQRELTRRSAVKAVALAAPLLLYLVYVALVYRTAWVSDDAFITLRTCYNALHGYGLRWNVAERVQTFTHPLWMFWLLAAHALSGEPFYSTLYLSWLVSCAAVAILFLGTEGGAFERALSLGLLIFSKSFVEYSSSGLENPLSHLWLACFAVLYLRRDTLKTTLPLSAIAGLAVLTRFDTALLYAPAWLARLARLRGQPGRTARQAFLAASLAGAPFAAWLAFSLVYYGFPWPNTAYAKLGVGEIAGQHRLSEALHYFQDSLRTDPLTLCSWLAIAVLLWLRRDVTRLWLIAGSLLSLGYVVAIGGDFMSGRFFSAPFFVAVACLASSELLPTRRLRLGALGLVVGLVALGNRPALFTGAGFGVQKAIEAVSEHGIHDARAEFFLHTSLANAARMSPAHHDHPWSGSGHMLRERAAREPRERVQVIDAIGLSGYYAGPQVHIVDHWALADPLLARLPSSFGALGHQTRVIPDGYLETLAGGMDVIRDPVIAEYYAWLSLITRGPLFSPQRWRAIWALNTGAFDARLRRACYVDTTQLTAHLRVTNITDRPMVGVYVWNDFRQALYVIDVKSERGKTYDVRWRVSAAGPELLTPYLRRSTTFRGLSDGGMFTLSATFSSSLAPGDTDIYELQYHYKRRGPLLTFLRSPLPSFTLGFPLGTWRVSPVSHAIDLVDAHYE